MRSVPLEKKNALVPLQTDHIWQITNEIYNHVPKLAIHNPVCRGFDQRPQVRTVCTMPGQHSYRIICCQTCKCQGTARLLVDAGTISQITTTSTIIEQMAFPNCWGWHLPYAWTGSRRVQSWVREPPFRIFNCSPTHEVTTLLKRVWGW